MACAPSSLAGVGGILNILSSATPAPIYRPNSSDPVLINLGVLPTDPQVMNGVTPPYASLPGEGAGVLICKSDTLDPIFGVTPPQPQLTPGPPTYSSSFIGSFVLIS